MKIIIYTILFVIIVLPVYSQIEIKGRIFNESNEPIPFANVIFYSSEDTTKIKYATISDFEGMYYFDNIKYGKYFISASSIGYKTRSTTYEFTQSIKANFLLMVNTKELDEVLVEESGIKHEIDKTTYIITESERLKAVSSLNLLESIPKLNIDDINKKISSMMGASVKILINGLNASEIELIALKPDQVIKLEYYDFPPARYVNSGFGAVINVITKKSAEGGIAGINIQNAPFTGFGNDLVNFKYNKKNSQFALSYYLSYRNYNERTENEILEYTLNDDNYRKERIGLKSPMAYKYNNIILDFINQKEKNYVFQVKLLPNFFISDRTVNQNIIQEINFMKRSGFSFKSSTYDEFKPVADIYFSKQLPKKQELLFNLVGTYFLTDNKYTKLETYQQDTLYSDYIDNQNNKNSLITEGMYSKQYNTMKTNYGYKHTQSYFSQTLDNSFDNDDYKTITSEEYIYAEAIGKLKKVSYQLSVGLSYNTFNEKYLENSYTFWSFRPIITLSYPVSKNSNIKARYINEPIIPSLSELSINKYFIDENIVYSGNPQLKPFREHTATIDFYYSIPRLDLNAVAYYSYSDNPILSEFSYTDNFILKTNNNGELEQAYAFLSAINYTPFKSGWLQFNLKGVIFNSENKISGYNKVKLFDYLMHSTMYLKYKKMTMKYTINNVYNELHGQYLRSTENYSTLGIVRNSKKWSVGIIVYYPFIDSWKTGYETVENSIVYNTGNSHIYNNGNMLILSFSYNFNFGRKFKEHEKSINNSDSDSGVFDELKGK